MRILSKAKIGFILLMIANGSIAFIGMHVNPNSFESGYLLSADGYYGFYDRDTLIWEAFIENDDQIYTSFQFGCPNRTQFNSIIGGGVYDWVVTTENTLLYERDPDRDVKITHTLSYQALFEYNKSILINGTWTQENHSLYWDRAPELFWMHDFDIEGSEEPVFEGTWRLLAQWAIIGTKNINGYSDISLMGLNSKFHSVFQGNITLSNNNTIREHIRIDGIALRFQTQIAIYKGLFRGWHLLKNITTVLGDGEGDFTMGTTDPGMGIPIVDEAED